MRIVTLRRIVSAVAFAIVTLLVATHVASLTLQKRTVAAADRLQRLTLLAAEMRDSSNALTRLARSYVVIGDSRVRERYFEVLDIRAGRQPRPDDYHVADWNLDRPPLEGGRPRSLLSMLKAEDPPPATYALLAEALAESESLAMIEMDAISKTASLIARVHSDVGERDPLIVSLHDQEYQRRKVRIMSLVDRFERAIRAHANADLHAMQRLQRLTLVLGVGILAAMIVGLVAFDRYTRRAILAPLARLGAAADRVSRGDYHARVHLDVENELGSLAKVFDRMADAIESDIAERDRMRREVESLARSDSLTGLANRRAFLESAEAELARVRRYGHDAAVLMMDVDHFKRINDAYGHAVGDEVLVRLGRLLRAEVREGDIVGRIGGEEFALLLPELDREGAFHVAERLRARVEYTDSIVTDAGSVRFTTSIGIALVDKTDVALSELLRRADAALYRSKHGGRNRVTLWKPHKTDLPSAPGA